MLLVPPSSPERWVE